MPQDPDAYLPHRRGFLAGGAALAGALLLPRAAFAQAVDSIHTLRGDVRVNGVAATPRTVIRAGDLVATGSDGYVVFRVGQDAFMVRQRSELQLEPGAEPLLVTGLRLLTGAIGAVFGRRGAQSVRIRTPTVTAGIRGTGCYAETRGDGTYFCTCYGTIALAANANPRDNETVTSGRHDNPRLVLAEPRNGQRFEAAPFMTHTDEEMDTLEKCVGRRAPWAR